MKSIVEKISLTLLIAAAIVWLGAINIRALIGLQLFELGTVDFKPGLDPVVEGEAFRQIASASVVAGVGYVIAWIAGFAFLRTTPLKVRRNGWLLMSAILFFAFTPVEIYTLILDGRFVGAVWQGTVALGDLQWLFVHRVTALSGLPAIATLCYYTIIPLAVWRPLVKKENQ